MALSAASGDGIADCVLKTFDSLPKKYKPAQRTTSQLECTVLSGIVLEKAGHALQCVALGTGVKSQPQSQILHANGNVVHDCHAEVLAIRAFNRYLLEELHRFATDCSNTSPFIRPRTKDERCSRSPQPFAFEDSVHIHMYSSDAPCGDASMELVMAMQDDPTPWQDVSKDNSDLLPGRGDFSRLGIVRRKPSRRDAPLTYSKSCTDKLSMMECTSVLKPTVSVLICPERGYLRTLVLPESQYVQQACSRAFSPEGRMARLTDSADIQWPLGYSFNPFGVLTTKSKFAYSRESIQEAAWSTIPSPKSMVWTPQIQEVLIRGFLEGRAAGDPKGASQICRRTFWTSANALYKSLGLEDLTAVSNRGSYRNLKNSKIYEARRQIKKDVIGSLVGWISNETDDFSLIE